ncbi:Stk1 family PASTA domain-containing Ser/Thr kinase [Peterkaempfera bronchialis]|uniref:non-specific serine/threonine protein kinase n=1 Tax=Peterkaempfera bronchialis TaxID=2126346 RepID=A0A345SY38_9ACTN|nr:Stk1 family PASTA domain-containing Ser/Thr kinase [Peterkaempfera bronchialis]AXI78643.1 Stk1 family PASTA domain-containing Ser/Thr kinase [Peterkaempfera bronchialis]
MEEPRRLGGRYELGAVLGRGGMAEVYLGHDIRLGRTVAVKTLRADMARDPSFQARFRREAQSAASLNHPSIVAVYDTGEDYMDGVSIPYIVMEYVDGSTLRELLHSGRRLLPERALEMTIGILQALEYSHRNGIVHRDIKPANVMLTRNGTVKVMDFGIARAMGDQGMTMTQTAAVIGTAQYLSPEQAKGEQVDARSDLYSTGCLIYELLALRPPFVGDSPVAVAYQHVREEPQPPSVYDPEVRPEVDAIVLKALAKDRDYRYQSADEMRDDIERFLDGLPVAAAQQVGAYGMGGYDNGYGADPYGGAPTTALPQQNPSLAGTTVLPPVTGTGDYGDDGGYGGRAGNRRNQQKKSNTSWIVLAIAAVLVLVGSFLVAKALFNGDGKADDVRVPSLVGHSVTEAEKLLLNSGGNFKLVEGDKVPCPVDTAPKGSICRQDQAADTTLAAGSTITVHLSSGPEQGEVPDLGGLTAKAAEQRLKEEGFQLGKVSEKETDNQGDQGNVISQQPKDGAKADKNSKVNITIGKAPEKVDAQDFTGQDRNTAEQTLKNAGFDVQVQEQENADMAGKVISQSAVGPQPKGASITLVVGKQPSQVQVPVVASMKLQEALDTLAQRGLQGRVVNGPQDSNATVASSDPGPGSPVDPGSTVNLVTQPGGGDNGGEGGPGFFGGNGG